MTKFITSLLFVSCLILAEEDVNVMQFRSVSIDGREINSPIQSIKDMKITFADETILDLKDLLTYQSYLSGSKVESSLIYAGAHVIPAGNISYEAGELTADSNDFGALSITDKKLRFVLLDHQKIDDLADIIQDISINGTVSDRVYAIGKNDKIRAIPAKIIKLDGENIFVNYRGEEKRISRPKVVAMAFAHSPEKLTTLVNLETRSGGIYQSDRISYDAGSAEISLFDKLLTLPWENINKININSPKCSFLSDLKPASEMSKSTLGLPYKTAFNQTIFGKKIILDKHTYEKGIAVHAESRIVYDIPPDYKFFIAHIGLDLTSVDSGNCIFKVSSDEKVLGSWELSGDKIHKLKLPLSGQKLRLEVLHGKNFDLGDFAIWADARIIK